MRRNLVTRFITFACLAMVLVGTAFDVNASGAASTEVTEEELRRPVGGGYAASSQINGAYFLPLLYDATNGLPTSEANCILASSDGYIWIGGYSGIVKYDGVKFERLSVSDGLTSGRGFYEDSKGRIWVATNDSGVVVIEGNVRHNFTKKDGLRSNSIRTFAEDDSGNVFIGSTAGLAYIDEDLNLHTIDDDRINTGRIPRLVSDVNGVVYGHTENGEVFKVSTSGLDDFYKSSDLGIEKVTTILADPEKGGKVYLGTNEECIYYGNFGSKASKMKKIKTKGAKEIHWLHYACDRLWVASVHDAGYVDENNNYIQFESLPMKDSFEMMTSDYQGNIWYASSRYGVMKIVGDNFLDITAAARLDEVVVNSTCKRGTDLYVGTDKGLNIIDKDYASKTNDLTKYFEDVRIRCIMNDTKGNTWFSTFSGDLGLVCLDKAGEITEYNMDNGMPTNEVRCTYEMSDGSIMVGTNAGVVIIKNGEITKTYGAEDGMNNTVILTVCEGFDGEIYAGSDGDGLYIIKNDKIERIASEDGISSDVVMRMRRDDDDKVIWLITSNALEYIKDDKIVNVASFPYNNNYDVISSKGDDLWVLSSQGIYVVSKQQTLDDSITSYKLYDRANGLTSMPIAHCYSGLDSKGNLYVAGQTGVSVVNIDNVYDFLDEPYVGVESVYYNGEEVLPDEGGVYRLPAEEGRVQINSAILDYTISNPLVRVFLQGMDDEGVTVVQSKLSTLEYTGLKYGKYILHIQILDGKTMKVISDNKYEIIKKPRFFERMAVKVILLILMIALTGLIVWRILTNAVIRKQYIQIQEARDEADKANSAKSRFLANMSHEIRTPINTIIGMDEMILREDKHNAPKEYYGPVTNYARDIKYASESLLSLINDLLDISKIEAGKMHLVEQEYDTEELLRGVAALIRGRADDKKLYFDLDIDETLPKRLYGDGPKLKQIISNLLTNACKYTNEGGFTLSVRVNARNEAGVMLRISVRDTGIGIKEEDLDKLFTAYERLDEVKNSNIQGTGLGLDISKQFAELMGGDLKCESIYGEGSEFIFTLKQKVVDSRGIGVFHEDMIEETGVYKPRFIAPDADILVVDDNPMNLNVIRGLLKPTQVFVTTADSGEDCLEKIKENEFNVVLLDHMMPGLDGIETLQRIRVTHPDLPVYALTANATSGGEQFYVSKGFNGYLTKPIDIIAVEHAIMKHLPESMMIIPSDDDEVVIETDLTEDVKWLESVEGISSEDGIKNSGGASQYLFALEMFYDSIDDNAKVIEKAYLNDDIKLATVKVHALKSSARIIGALKFSEDCQALEDAGNNKDMDFIAANKDRLLSDYRAFKKVLKRIKGDAVSDDNKEMISEENLADAYSALKECISQMDYDAVEMILSELEAYSFADKDEEIMNSLRKNLRLVNWEGMEEVIQNV